MGGTSWDSTRLWTVLWRPSSVGQEGGTARFSGSFLGLVLISHSWVTWVTFSSNVEEGGRVVQTRALHSYPAFFMSKLCDLGQITFLL